MPNKNSSTSRDRRGGLLAGVTAGLRQAEQDRRHEAAQPAPVIARGALALDRIRERAENTRALAADHVAALAESIAVLGLIEPLVVDQEGRLLAGAHRLAALRQLREKDPPRFARQFPEGVIPARIMPLRADEEPSKALAIEVAENEHRRDYTKTEAVELARRLVSAGYKDTPGRPKEGEKALAPALMVVLGKSLATVRRLLREERTVSPDTNTAPRNVHERSLLKALRRYLAESLAETLAESAGGAVRAEAEALAAAIERIIG